MKNHNEMYQSLLSRYNEHQEKKIKRIRTIRRTVPVLACFCLTIALGVGYWDHFRNLPHIPVQPSIIEEPTVEIHETTTTASTDANTTVSSMIPSEPASTTALTTNSKTERITTSADVQTQTVTTVVTDATESPTTEQVVKQAETQAPITTASVIQTTVNTEQQTTIPIQTTNSSPIVPPIDIELPAFTFETYDDYKHFLENNNLPEEFIEYDRVKDIGSFKSLVFLTDTRYGDYSEYMYGFSEASQNTVFLTVVPSSKGSIGIISTPLSIDDINQSDMRFTKNEGVSGIFKVDNLSYKYINGILLSITWENSGLRYSLSCSSTFSEYQLNQDAFTAKLLVYDLIDTDSLF